jgi:N-glycosylase/DNA lyase
MIRIDAKYMNLEQTLDCGQAFRWKKNENGDWVGIAFGKKLKLYKDGNQIILDCSESDYQNIWHNYFDMDTDYSSIRKRLSSIDPVLKEATEYCPGIRILRQEPWEAMCSFIISQNNNIPRIKLIIERLCNNFGEKLDEDYTFPDAKKIASLEVGDLDQIKSGFRASYIIAGARAIDGDATFINRIQNLSVEKAREELMKIRGIGPKVADCTLLYGFHRMECFPVDVWMKKAMSNLLPDITPDIFGEDAGIAQQYIFHYSRMHPEKFLKTNDEAKQQDKET